MVKRIDNSVVRPMTLIFSGFRAVVKRHVRTKFHQAVMLAEIRIFHNLAASNFARSSIMFDDHFPLGRIALAYKSHSVSRYDSVEGMSDEHKLKIVLQSVLNLFRRVSSLKHT